MKKIWKSRYIALAVVLLISLICAMSNGDDSDNTNHEETIGEYSFVLPDEYQKIIDNLGLKLFDGAPLNNPVNGKMISFVIVYAKVNEVIKFREYKKRKDINKPNVIMRAFAFYNLSGKLDSFVYFDEDDTYKVKNPIDSKKPEPKKKDAEKNKKNIGVGPKKLASLYDPRAFLIYTKTISSFQIVLSFFTPYKIGGGEIRSGVFFLTKKSHDPASRCSPCLRFASTNSHIATAFKSHTKCA